MMASNGGGGGFWKFWKSLPGIITAIATLITSLVTAGIITQRGDGPKPPPPSDGTSATATTAPGSPSPTLTTSTMTVNLEGYCQYKGYSGVRLYKNDITGWRCYTGGSSFDVDMYDACGYQYPGQGGVPAYSDYNNPKSWHCNT